MPFVAAVFALVIDVFLRRVQRHIPDAGLRAFADDIAAVLQDSKRGIATIAQLFEEVSKVVGLYPNIPKCVFMPL